MGSARPSRVRWRSAARAAVSALRCRQAGLVHRERDLGASSLVLDQAARALGGLPGARDPLAPLAQVAGAIAPGRRCLAIVAVGVRVRAPAPMRMPAAAAWRVASSRIVAARRASPSRRSAWAASQAASRAVASAARIAARAILLEPTSLATGRFEAGARSVARPACVGETGRGLEQLRVVGGGRRRRPFDLGGQALAFGAAFQDRIGCTELHDAVGGHDLTGIGDQPPAGGQPIPQRQGVFEARDPCHAAQQAGHVPGGVPAHGIAQPTAADLARRRQEALSDGLLPPGAIRIRGIVEDEVPAFASELQDHRVTDDDRAQQVTERGLHGDPPVRVDLQALGQTTAAAPACGRGKAATLGRLEHRIERGEPLAQAAPGGRPWPGPPGSRRGTGIERIGLGTRRRPRPPRRRLRSRPRPGPRVWPRPARMPPRRRSQRPRRVRRRLPTRDAPHLPRVAADRRARPRAPGARAAGMPRARLRRASTPPPAPAPPSPPPARRRSRPGHAGPQGPAAVPAGRGRAVRRPCAAPRRSAPRPRDPASRSRLASTSVSRSIVRRTSVTEMRAASTARRAPRVASARSLKPRARAATRVLGGGQVAHRRVDLRSRGRQLRHGSGPPRRTSLVHRARPAASRPSASSPAASRRATCCSACAARRRACGRSSPRMSRTRARLASASASRSSAWRRRRSWRRTPAASSNSGRRSSGRSESA